jgi:hypothetical protein
MKAAGTDAEQPINRKGDNDLKKQQIAGGISYEILPTPSDDRSLWHSRDKSRKS